jgi:hypothetical protein
MNHDTKQDKPIRNLQNAGRALIAKEWKSLKNTKVDLNAIRASGAKVKVWHGESDTLYRVITS